MNFTFIKPFYKWFNSHKDDDFHVISFDFATLFKSIDEEIRAMRAKHVKDEEVSEEHCSLALEYRICELTGLCNEHYGKVCVNPTKHRDFVQYRHFRLVHQLGRPVQKAKNLT